MTSVVVFTVGKELLIGKTVNTNAHWIGGRLYRMGGMISRTLTVTDSLDEISSGLKELLALKPDYVVVVGGLGPTPDDMTLKGVARALRRNVRVNREALQMIAAHYERVHLSQMQMTPARRKMAMLPEGSIPLQNEVGTAPGVRLEYEGSIIFCLPGVPREMKSIFKGSIEGEIKKKMGTLYTSKAVMMLEGIYESTLAPMIGEALKLHPSSYIKSHPLGLKEGRSRIELDMVVTSRRKEDARKECDEISAFFVGEISKAGGTITKRSG